MIKRKREVPRFIKGFTNLSEWDGTKHYFTFQTVNPLGAITLMKYQDGNFTYHRKNELFWDLSEIPIENISDFVWNYRKEINQSLEG